MTNHYIDFRNADVILNMGSNVCENHPVSYKWIKAAQDRGAVFIHVDPRFTRTSAKADHYVALRSGTDIAFLGGMIKYILDNDLIQREYVVNYTNASFIVGSKYDFMDGLFSGYDPVKRKYDKSHWAFETDENGVIKKDPTLQDPRCVYQLLKKHYARYDPDVVSQITGTPKEDLLKIYQIYGSTGRPDRVGTELYAMGWTQHTVGTQNIRTMAMIQLLLGNMGMAGGGINALRGESNVQGSTDMALLFHIISAYNPTPQAKHKDLATYNEMNTPKTKEPMSANWWQNRPKYMVSYLKSMYGKAATKENDFGYDWHPKLDDDQNCSWLMLFDAMHRGEFTGFFAWGMNPACSGANANKVRQGLASLDWMVNVNLFDNETGSFWHGPGMNPKKIKTEVFQLPCASFMEKEGSLSNSGRWVQWRYKAVDPPGEAKPDGDIILEIYERVRELYAKEGGKCLEPVLNLKMDYATNGKFDAHKVAKECNGYDLTTGKLVTNFTKLKDDGTTSSGNWLYSGSYNEDGNMMARRDRSDPTGIGLYSKWAWCWPVNRRIIYNRASVDLNGNPWDPKRPVIKWNPEKAEGKGGWDGDVPDGGWPPMVDKEKTKLPFIMKPHGVASIFGPGLNDGPFPEHYEPLECPVEKNLLSSQRINPAAKVFAGTMDQYHTCDPRYPFVCTTYRVTEHWQTGVLTRWLPWLLETQPQLFVEMSKELGELRGIKNGDLVEVETARGKVKAVAIVTARWKPFKIAGQTVHQIGIPWHFGWRWPEDKKFSRGGDSANLLTPNIGDANTMIPESKAFMANVRKIKSKS